MIDVMELAKLGAVVRLREMKEEMAALQAVIKGQAVEEVQEVKVEAVPEPATEPAKWSMSASQRRAISERMKAYWATKRRKA